MIWCALGPFFVSPDSYRDFGQTKKEKLKSRTCNYIYCPMKLVLSNSNDYLSFIFIHKKKGVHAEHEPL